MIAEMKNKVIEIRPHTDMGTGVPLKGELDRLVQLDLFLDMLQDVGSFTKEWKKELVRDEEGNVIRITGPGIKDERRIINLL
jgi:hypothetical protein